jgi:hypothetical protein
VPAEEMLDWWGSAMERHADGQGRDERTAAFSRMFSDRLRKFRVRVDPERASTRGTTETTKETKDSIFPALVTFESTRTEGHRRVCEQVKARTV